MKKIVITLALLLAFIGAQANFTRPVPKVDECVELLSIVFRLAEAQEYVNNDLKLYIDDVDEYFKPYKQHDLIKWIPELREKYGIAYDAVASYAIHISIDNNIISFIDNAVEGDLESRWTQEVADEFLKKLNDFYTVSKFNQFYTNHKPLYKLAEERFGAVLDLVNFEWFETFYGVKPNGNFNLIISLTNGPGNYGGNVTYKNGKEDLFAIIGSWATDSVGYPVYSPRLLETIIHEFNHSFCNPLADEFYPQMKGVTNEFYNLYADILKMQAYGNAKTMLREILVRAAVIQYYKGLDGSVPLSIKRMVTNEQQRGFVWIDKLCDLLSEYEVNRNKYPNLKSFMPEVVEMHNGLSPQKVVEAYREKKIKIVSTSIANGDMNVDPKTEKLFVSFDKVMNIKANGASYGKRGKAYFPEILKAEWDTETKKEWIVYIKLQPDTEYSLSFPSQFFVGENGESVLETYYLDFKTGK